MFRIVLCGLFVCLLSVFSFGFRPLVVVGASMSPTLMPGQVAVLNGGYYRTHPLERGDVVVFHWEGETYVKRVHALAGEPVLMLCQSGYCIPVEEGEESRAFRLENRKVGFYTTRATVPPDHFYSLGDHLPASEDSREIGPIPVSAIVGRVQAFKNPKL